MSLKRCVFYVFLTIFAWTANPSPSAAQPISFAPIVKSEKEKVVHISISSVTQNFHRPKMDPFFEKFFPNIPKERKQQALGSGLIVSSDGYIATNHHVVAKADKIEVILYSGKKYKAKIVAKDKQTELALIKIQANDLPFIKWGDSSAMEVGDWVLAIGNPLGLDHTVTAGIISARGRRVFGETAYGQFLQTDAAINFGNSGGPLFNLKSEVIGINTAIVVGGQNLGFAIPSNLAQKVIGQLKKYGVVKRGWFGVGIQNVSHDLADAFDLPKGMKGVAVTSVIKNSPAGKGGLRQGDVIVKFNGRALETASKLQQMVAETEPGNKVKVQVFRDGKFLDKTVKVGLKKDGRSGRRSGDYSDKYGWYLKPAVSQVQGGEKGKIDYGLVAVDIDENGLAWDIGIRKGDILLKANGYKLKSLKDLHRVIERSKKTSRPAVNILLKTKVGNTVFVALPAK